MTKQLKLSALLVALVASTGAMAQQSKPGYTADASTDAVVRNSFGECWRNSFFDKATEGLAECGDAEEAIVDNTPTYKDETVSLATEFLFGFDSNSLRPEAVQTLDQLATRLSDTKVQAVRVEGFTDGMGNPQYNQGLSERRSSAVANYLINKGVPASKVQSVGYGATRATLDAECRAEAAKLKVTAAKQRLARIACNAPDRRVDLQIRSIVTKEVQ